MTVSLLILAMLVIVVFGFVLEPVLRARRDDELLGTIDLPESVATGGVGGERHNPAHPEDIEQEPAEAVPQQRAVSEPSHAEGSS